MSAEKFTRKVTNFDEVIFTRSVETEKYTGSYRPEHHWPALDTSSKVLPAGYQVSEVYRPTICDMILDKDQPIRLRDGAIIYADIFRPVDESKTYPVLLTWTPYGKIDPPNNYGLYANRAWMQRKNSTGLDTFEGPEPDYWVSNEYIVAVVDSRGSTNSESVLYHNGYEEGVDIYDTIEWLGVQPWSSGKVSMIGNSWLAICQYYAAAMNPPHLACIAPWEGHSDYYRDVCCRGGIPSAEFFDALNKTFRIKEGIEDVHAMLKKYPLINDYWAKEKRADLEKITVPAYVTASWTSFVHPYGTLRAWGRISSKEKWLRVHNTQEWPDQQTPKYRDDLKYFYDHFMKGIDNGWQNTPKVRVSILDPTGQDIVDRPEEDFPLPRTDYKKLYLNGKDLSLSYDPVEEEADAVYPVGFWEEERDPFSKNDYSVKNENGQIQFRITFKEDTELCGYFKTKLYVSTDSSDDMDLFMYVTKEDSMGWPYYPVVLGVDYMGPEARLRVSHRKIECDDLFDWRHEHKAEELIEPNEVVEIETVFWPVGMTWRKGETLVFTISSKELQLFEFPTLPVQTRNKGNHIIHTGGKYASYLEIPVV